MSGMEEGRKCKGCDGVVGAERPPGALYCTNKCREGVSMGKMYKRRREARRAVVSDARKRAAEGRTCSICGVALQERDVIWPSKPPVYCREHAWKIAQHQGKKSYRLWCKNPNCRADLDVSRVFSNDLYCEKCHEGGKDTGLEYLGMEGDR